MIPAATKHSCVFLLLLDHEVPHEDSGNSPVTMSVSFLIPMHEFGWLFRQAVAGRYGHDAEGYEWLLTGVELDYRQTASREDPQTAF